MSPSPSAALRPKPSSRGQTKNDPTEPGSHSRHSSRSAVSYASRTSSHSGDIELEETNGETAKRRHSLGYREASIGEGAEGLLTDESDDDDMATSRPPLHRPTDGRSQVPLLKDERRGRQRSDELERYAEGGRQMSTASRASRFRSRTPDYDSHHATRRKYMIAAFFLLLSLVSFVVQTETAVYIQHELGWNKPYCMLYFTHGSWVFLWPAQLLILRLQKWKLSWKAFWRRHLYLVRTTAQMVQSGDLHLTTRASQKSPVPYMVKATAGITTFLTVAGGSWYLAVNLTTASDLTAIYNCSAFFAYVFSIWMLNDKLRLDKVFSVAVAVAGVLVVAYGPAGATDGTDPKHAHLSSRVWGNIIIGVGSVLYGCYEVMYKKYACPPEGTSPGRGVIFANTFASMIGAFTILVLWIPLPILHVMGWETFVWPTGKTGGLLLISTLSNATFSGSFLVLISLTSPVLSSVAALLTIFLVAIVDWLRSHKPLTSASIIGGLLIVVAFVLLSWSTYREMDEERRKRLAEEGPDSESDE